MVCIESSVKNDKNENDEGGRSNGSRSGSGGIGGVVGGGRRRRRRQPLMTCLFPVHVDNKFICCLLLACLLNE